MEQPQQQAGLEGDLYQLIQGAIASNDNELVSKISDKILLKDPSDEQIRLCQTISALKLCRMPELCSNFFTKIPQPNDAQPKVSAYLLFLIQGGQYDTCISYIKKGNMAAKQYEYELFLAHCFYKLQDYPAAAETYLSALKKIEKVDQALYSQCIVNLLACGQAGAGSQQLAENYIQKNI